DETLDKPVDDYPWLEKVVTLNQNNGEVENYLMDVADYWMEEANIDGFKLHAADQASPDFLNTLTNHIKEVNADAYIIADVLDKDTSELQEINNIQLVNNVNQFEAMADVFSKENTPV